MITYTIGETAKMLNLSAREVEQLLISGEIESLLAEDVHTYQMKRRGISCANSAASHGSDTVLRGIEDMMLSIAGEELS